jgi:predicted  nucleic acid-binding Zn-ribbon protein
LSLEDIFPKSLFLKFDPLLEGGLLALNNEISFLKGRDRDLSEMILELQEENEFLKDIIEKNTSTIDDHIDDEGEEMKFEVEMHSHPIVHSG